MVQLVSRSRHDIDNVYKLGFEPGRSVYSLNRILQYFDDAGYYRPTRPSWTHAFQLVVRYQSGLLSYEKYGVAELRAFAAACEITRTCSVTRCSLEKTRKADLVPILEQADDERTFRLMDLPPELRNTIYVAYLASLPTMPMRFIQPPLCLASRQLRDDTLKVFFSTCSFTLVFHVEGHRFRGRASETYGVSVDETIFQRHPPDCFNSQWAKLVSQRQGPRKLGIGDIDTMRLALQEVASDKRFPWLGYLPQWRRTRGGRAWAWEGRGGELKGASCDARTAHVPHTLSAKIAHVFKCSRLQGCRTDAQGHVMGHSERNVAISVAVSDGLLLPIVTLHITGSSLYAITESHVGAAFMLL